MPLLIPFVIHFLISFALVTVSSYLLASVFEPKKYGIGFLYTVLICFAQIVLTFEILSLLNQINVAGVIISNIVFFTAIISFWDSKGKPLYRPQFKKPMIRIFKALRKDKILLFLAMGFLFLVCAMIIVNIFMPVNSFDAMVYHLNRAAVWVSNGNLNHFDIADDRNLVMPINSEILYSWVLVLLKNDWGLGLFSFMGYVLSIFSLYNLIGFFGFGERKKLWAVFIVSSFASVIAEATSIETDIIIAGLVLTSIFLYLVSIKEKKISLIAFSSLAFALAIGTKSPAVIAFPGVFLLLAYFSARWMNKEFYKPLLTFLGFLFVNFLFFASFNYILNFIDFGNFLGTESARIIHSFWGGPKAFIGNFIRYNFMLFDFSGFKYSIYLGQYILAAKFFLFNLLNIPHNLGVTMGDNNVVNNGLMDVTMGAGILGFLVFLPCTIASIILGFVKRSNPKMLNLLPFGLLFFINLLVMSGVLGYMVFSIRFITFFIVISSPVLVLSYFKKNPFVKLLILFFALSYMVLISQHLSARSFKDSLRIFKENKDVYTAREVLRCSLYRGYVGQHSFCHLRDKIRTFPAGSKIGIFTSYDDRLYPIIMLNQEGYKIKPLLSETVDMYDLSEYDYLIKTNEVQVSSYIKAPERALTDYELNGKDFTFFPNHPAKCIYLGKNSYPVTKADVRPITYALCRIPEEYIYKQGFKIMKIIKYESQLRENTNTMYFYENMHKSN